MKQLNLFLILTFLSLRLFAQPELTLSPFASGLQEPVDIAHPPQDSRLFIVERGGRIQILQQDGSKNATPFLDITGRVRSSGNEQGLLGLAFPPDYASSGYFYINYTQANRATRVSRFSVDPNNPDQALPGSEEILIEVDQPFNNHNAGCLQFGPDSLLYIAMGDGGAGGDPGDRAQNGQSLLGKLLRIDVSMAPGYTVPADNPFVSDGSVLDEIWSLGWRNPWKFSFDRQTGDMWIADVGQDAREEINLEAPGTGGLNYGWRCREGSINFNSSGCSSGYVDPVFDYPHGFSTGQSVTGGFVYRGQTYPDLQGHYVYGDYGSGNIWTLAPDGDGGFTNLLQGKLLPNGELSTFGQDADGELYVASKNDGVIFLISSTGSSASLPMPVQPLQVQPLPDGQLRIIWPEQAAATFRLYNLQGQLLREESVRGGSLRLGSDLPAGLYLAEIQGERSYRGRLLMRP